MTENYSESKVTLNPPSFDGTKEQFRFYEKKMHAYLAAAGCGRVLQAVESEICADAYDWEAVNNQGNRVHTDEEVEEGKKLQALNAKAAGIILSSISTKTKAGEQAWNLVAKFFDDDYGGGFYPRIWQTLKKWYKTVVASALDTVRDKYYEQRMKLTEQPSMYVMTMILLRKELHDLGYEITDVTLIERVLKTLPTNNEGMCPYDAKKAMIQQKMSPEATQVERDSMTIKEVTMILERVFQEKNLGNTAITDDGENGFYMGGSNKGRCHGCGKQGHYIANCPDKKGSNKYSGQGRFNRPQGPNQKKDHRNKLCFQSVVRREVVKEVNRQTSQRPRKGMR
jgi:hypothetical protein